MLQVLAQDSEHITTPRPLPIPPTVHTTSANASSDTTRSCLRPTKSKTDLHDDLSGPSSDFGSVVRGDISTPSIQATPKPPKPVKTVDFAQASVPEATPKPRSKSKDPATSTNPPQVSRAAIRAAKLLDLQKEQQKEDDEALRMTEAQHQALLSSFSAVKVEFFDLDGLAWTGSAVKRANAVTSTAKRGHRYTVSEGNISPIISIKRPGISERQGSKSVIVSSTSSPSSGLSSASAGPENDSDEQVFDDDDNNNDHTIRAAISPFNANLAKAEHSFDATPSRPPRAVSRSTTSTSTIGPAGLDVDDDFGATIRALRPHLTASSDESNANTNQDSDNETDTQDEMESNLFVAGVAGERTRSNSLREAPIVVRVDVEKVETKDPASKPSLQLLRSHKDRNAPPPPSHPKASTTDADTLSPPPTYSNRSRILRPKRIPLSPTHANFNLGPLPSGQSNAGQQRLSPRVSKQTRRPKVYSSFGLGMGRSSTDPGMKERRDTPVPASVGMKRSTSDSVSVPGVGVVGGKTLGLRDAGGRKDTPMPGTLAALETSSTSTSTSASDRRPPSSKTNSESLLNKEFIPDEVDEDEFEEGNSMIIDGDDTVKDPFAAAGFSVMDVDKTIFKFRRDLTAGLRSDVVAACVAQPLDPTPRPSPIAAAVPNSAPSPKSSPGGGLGERRSMAIPNLKPTSAQFTEDDDDEIETDLEGGAMLRRTPLSPRMKATVVVASPRCIRSGENKERKMEREKVVETERGVYPRLEIYRPATPVEVEPEDVAEETNEDEEDITVKVSSHEMLVAFREMKEEDAMTKPTLTIDTSETITTIIPLVTRVPSLLVKDREHLKVVSSESGLASPSVLTPTPSLIEGGSDCLGFKYPYPATINDIDKKNTTPTSDPATLGVGRPFHSRTALPPTRIPSLRSASGSKRKRGQNSGRSISSTGSLLGLTSLASGTTDDSTFSGETSLTSNLSLPPRPMSPPSPPRIALVTAERSEEAVSNALYQIRAVSSTAKMPSSSASKMGLLKNQTRARPVGGESEKPVRTRTHGPNAIGVRRMDGMPNVHA